MLSSCLPALFLVCGNGNDALFQSFPFSKVVTDSWHGRQPFNHFIPITEITFYPLHYRPTSQAHSNYPANHCLAAGHHCAVCPRFQHLHIRIPPIMDWQMWGDKENAWKSRKGLTTSSRWYSRWYCFSLFQLNRRVPLPWHTCSWWFWTFFCKFLEGTDHTCYTAVKYWKYSFVRNWH